MALPSPEETQRTIEVINQLETELREAVEALELAKSRILKLERYLEERRWWIAPIRRIPTEILAEVFLRASETEMLAPLKLASVSWLWREIMFATPWAWSFIYLEKCGDFSCSDVYLNTFLKRSHPRLLHLCVPEPSYDSTDMITPILVRFLHRIECLTISPSQLEALNRLTINEGDIRLLHLRRLWLIMDETDADISFFDMSRFPSLQFLCWPPYQGDQGGSHPTFAHLQHFSVQADVRGVCLDVIESCTATLRSLDVLCIYTEYEEDPPESGIEPPLLQSLRLNIDDEIKCNFITPALVSVSLTLGPSSTRVPFGADINKVTHLRLDHDSNYWIPAGYNAVRCLQLYFPPRYNYVGGTPKYVELLKAAASALPSLEVIEVNTEGCPIPDWDLIM